MDCRRAMNGRSTDEILDRIFWGLTNVATKEQINLLLKHFTVTKRNGADRHVIPELETGSRYKPRRNVAQGTLFENEPLGDMTLRNLMAKPLAEIIIAACIGLGLKCSAEEAHDVENAINTAYARGHAGKQSSEEDHLTSRRRSTRNVESEQTGDDDVYVGGTEQAGTLIDVGYYIDNGYFITYPDNCCRGEQYSPTPKMCGSIWL